MCSLVETAKANDVEPFAYLGLVLNEIRWFGKAPPAVELDALLPWNPALQKKRKCQTEPANCGPRLTLTFCSVSRSSETIRKRSITTR